MDERGPVRAALAVVGWALIGFGVATWAVGLTIFEPALSTLVGSEFARGVNFDDVDILAAYLVRLPWMSILVAVAGALLMLRRSRLRGRLGWGLLLGWLAVDIVLDWLNVAGPLAAIVTGAVAAVTVVGVVIVGALRTGPPIDRPAATVYSGVLLAAVFLVAVPTGSPFVAHYPAGLFGVTRAVAAALALATIITAGTAAATISTRRALAVGAFIAMLAVGVVLVRVEVFGDTLATIRLAPWAFYPVIGAVPVVLALLANGVTRRALPGLALLAVLAPVNGVVLFLIPAVGFGSVLMITAYVGFYDEALLSWVAVLIGLVGGAVLGAVALIPELVRRHPGPVVVDAAVQAPSYS